MISQGHRFSVMHRFFIPPEWLREDEVTIRGRQAHQIGHVLRLKRGDRIIVLDNAGYEYETALLEVTRDRVRGRIEGRRRCTGEPALEVTLYQALLKGDGIETVLQKCTEIGVSAFVLFEGGRCVARPPRALRLERWRAILTEAAEQSGRGRVPGLEGVITFTEACERVSGLAIMPWEGETKRGIREVLQSAGFPFSIAASGEVKGSPGKVAQPTLPRKLSIFIGPEGGFTGEEVEFARGKGITPVSLGKRILRAETAGLVTAALALYQWGEMEAIPKYV